MCYKTGQFYLLLTLVPAAEYAGDPRATAIAEAARRLVALRERWLNPPEWAADTS